MPRMDPIVPEICVHNGTMALDFYHKAFGAQEAARMTTPQGKLIHGDLTIGGHRLFVIDEFDSEEGGTCRSPRTLGGTGVRLNLEVEDADETVERAVRAGAKVMMPVQEMFWGARYGKIIDPFGHEWGINQTLEELSEGDVQERAKEFFAKT